MMLQANYNGAWKNVTPFVEANSDLEALRRAQAPDAPALRIKDGSQVVWTWNAKAGWHRPHWYNREERWGL